MSTYATVGEALHAAVFETHRDLPGWDEMGESWHQRWEEAAARHNLALAVPADPIAARCTFTHRGDFGLSRCDRESNHPEPHRLVGQAEPAHSSEPFQADSNYAAPVDPFENARAIIAGLAP